jgi:hypothetical protein
VGGGKRNCRKIIEGKKRKNNNKNNSVSIRHLCLVAINNGHPRTKGILEMYKLIENENRSTLTYQEGSLCIHSYISPLASHLMMNSYVFVDLMRIEVQRFIIDHEDFDVIDTSTCRNIQG